jgi:hypothetical protein
MCLVPRIMDCLLKCSLFSNVLIGLFWLKSFVMTDVLVLRCMRTVHSASAM